MGRRAELEADAAAAAVREADLREAARIAARADEHQELRELGALEQTESRAGDEAVRDELARRAGEYVRADADAWLAQTLAAYLGHCRVPSAREEAAGALTPPVLAPAALLAALARLVPDTDGDQLAFAARSPPPSPKPAAARGREPWAREEHDDCPSPSSAVGVVPGTDWTQLLKDLTVAVEVRNRRVASLRAAGSTVAELTAQALAAAAPGAPPRRILAGMGPLVEHKRPHVCGQGPVVAPGRPALPQQAADVARVIRQSLSANDAFGDTVPVRYSLEEAWEKGILPWRAPTARTCLRRRSQERGIPVPDGRLEGQTVRYTKDELTIWRTAWQKRAGPTTGRPPASPESASC